MPEPKNQNYQRTTRIFIKIDGPKPQNSPPEITVSSLFRHTSSNTLISELLKKNNVFIAFSPHDFLKTMSEKK